MYPRKVLIVGGSGFVGSAVASQLAAAGVALVLPTRRRDRARHLLPLPTAEVVEADVFDPPTLRRLMAGVDAVVSLVGVTAGYLYSQRYRPVFHSEAQVRVGDELDARSVPVAMLDWLGSWFGLALTDGWSERRKRLLLRHEELQRTNTLLTDQVIALTQERDLLRLRLRLRLQAARARVDALIERLPANQGE